MAILSIDYGTVRIGLALSDELGMFASPLTVLKYSSGVVEDIAEIVRHNRVERIVLGMPYRLDGTESDSTQRVKEFAQRLRETVDCPVVEWDESFSTIHAAERMREAGVRKKKRRQKGESDLWAAAVILQEYLDSLVSG